MTRILQTNKVYWAISIAIGALFGVLLLRSMYNGSINQSSSILAGNRVIPVTIADTEALRELGLSGTSLLTSGTGKLFIFDKPQTPGFWMKDMQYPLDIVWIDANWHVIAVTNAITPESYPAIFYPPSPVLYVLEINANEATVDNLSVGTQLQFKK